MVTWDEARKLMLKAKDVAWNCRTQYLPDEDMSCPRCGLLWPSECEVQEWEWNGETYEPIADTALAPEAYCENCDHWMVNPYGIVHITEAGCHHCHEPLPTNYYERGGRGFCDEECADESEAS